MISKKKRIQYRRELKVDIEESNYSKLEQEDKVGGKETSVSKIFG